MMSAERPATLWSWWEAAGPIEKARLTDLLVLAYAKNNHPQKQLGIEQWVIMFRHAGFFVREGPSASFDTSTYVWPPTTPLRLYRAAERQYRRGMSWTLNYGWARNRANMWMGAGSLFMVKAPPRAVLAMFNGVNAPTEQEVVVDPNGLPPDLTDLDYGDPSPPGP